MGLVIALALGAALGGWLVGYVMNRYYQSEVWAHSKRVTMEHLKTQESAEILERTKNEAETHKLLRGLEDK